MFLGLRSQIYPAPDLAAAKAFYTTALGVEPYYDEGPYVGFSLGGYELGLFEMADPAQGPRSYWGVGDIDRALAHLLDNDATLEEDVHDVGDGIRMASVRDPFGQVFGLIENPVFARTDVDGGAGPGR